MAATAPQDQGHSPQYQEPGPQSQPETAPESPATSPFEYHEHHYQEHPSPQAEPNPITAGKKIILTEKEEKQYLEELVRHGFRLRLFGPGYDWDPVIKNSPELQSHIPVRLVWGGGRNRRAPRRGAGLRCRQHPRRQ